MERTDPCPERSWWECWRNWRLCGSEHSISDTLRDSAWARWAWRRPAGWALGHQRALWRSAPAHQSTPATPVRLAHSAHFACFWFEYITQGLLTISWPFLFSKRDHYWWWLLICFLKTSFSSLWFCTGIDFYLLYLWHILWTCTALAGWQLFGLIVYIYYDNWILMHAWDLADSTALWNIEILNKNFGWISLKENSWQLKLKTEYP